MGSTCTCFNSCDNGANETNAFTDNLSKNMNLIKSNFLTL